MSKVHKVKPMSKVHQIKPMSKVHLIKLKSKDERRFDIFEQLVQARKGLENLALHPACLTTFWSNDSVVLKQWLSGGRFCFDVWSCPSNKTKAEGEVRGRVSVQEDPHKFQMECFLCLFLAWKKRDASAWTSKTSCDDWGNNFRKENFSFLWTLATWLYCILKKEACLCVCLHLGHWNNALHYLLLYCKFTNSQAFDLGKPLLVMEFVHSSLR